MRALSLLFAVALLLLAALAWFAPAALLDSRLDLATHGQLRLANATGTVWNGRGVVTNTPQTWSLPVGWKVDPKALLLRGELAITLQAADGDVIAGSPRGNVFWHDPTLALEGFALTLPAATLNGTIAAANTLALGGIIAVDAPHLLWNGRSGDGSATAMWTGARLAGPAGMLALGTITANLAPRDGRVVGHVENRGGDARIDGEFALSSAGGNVDATLTPLPSTPPNVARALAALGTPDATGAVRVQWRSGAR